MRVTIVGCPSLEWLMEVVEGFRGIGMDAKYSSFSDQVPKTGVFEVVGDLEGIKNSMADINGFKTKVVGEGADGLVVEIVDISMPVLARRAGVPLVVEVVGLSGYSQLQHLVSILGSLGLEVKIKEYSGSKGRVEGVGGGGDLNADRLASKLEGAGFPLFVLKIESVDGPENTVVVRI